MWLPPPTQLPRMKAPFGVSPYTDESTGATTYSLDLSFAGMDGNDKLRHTYEQLKGLDEKVMETALAHPDWFPKIRKVTRESLDALQARIVKEPSKPEDKGKYPDRLKLKLAQDPKSGDFITPAFDDGKQLVNLAEIDLKGGDVTAIVKISGIWVSGMGFGCSLKPMQLKVVPRVTLSGYAFNDEEDDAPAAAESLGAEGSTGERSGDGAAALEVDVDSDLDM